MNMHIFLKIKQIFLAKDKKQKSYPLRIFKYTTGKEKKTQQNENPRVSNLRNPRGTFPVTVGEIVLMMCLAIFLF